MVQPKEYTKEEVELLVDKLQKQYPDCSVKLLHSDPRFIRITQKIGEQRVDTIPVSLTKWVDVHIFEVEFQLFSGF